MRLLDGSAFFRVLLTVSMVLGGCAYDSKNGEGQKRKSEVDRATEILERIREQYAPDPHLAVFDVGIESRGTELRIAGEVSEAKAKTAILREFGNGRWKIRDEIKLLPDPALGDQTWGVVSLSVANGREKPDHKAEMGTQGLMGQTVRILKLNRRWLYVQTADRYLSWMESGAVTRCTAEQAETWNSSSRLIVTNYEECVREQPRAEAQPVSDLVMGNLVKQLGQENGWIHVELPDGRRGFLAKSAAEDYEAWKRSRQPTAEHIERTARLLLGRPYLWGGNSSKAADCSGFCKLVFFLNGIDLNRNASEQALQGEEVAIDQDFSKPRKGDLLFFGWRGRGADSAWVTHVAIYLGDKRFIQSSERVRISSLDPKSPDFDSFHTRSLVFARRILKE
jgi:cell wall-associated NlpC family hydrolase